MQKLFLTIQQKIKTTTPLTSPSSCAKQAFYSTIVILNSITNITVFTLFMSDLAKYLVRSPKQILNYLKLLSAERCLISAAFGASDKDTFLSAIMDIDEKKQTITIDCGPKEYLNRKLLKSPVIKCSTEYKGIKVYFEGRKAVKTGSASEPAFLVPMPTTLYWVQRRQFYRIRSPLSKQSYCVISFKDPETEQEKTLNLELYDLSATGISIINDSSEFAKLLEPSVEFNKCRLVLQDEAPLSVDLEIRHILPQSSNNPGKKERIGCYITNSTPRIETTILRYMQNIERELKQKSL